MSGLESHAISRPWHALRCTCPRRSFMIAEPEQLRRDLEALRQERDAMRAQLARQEDQVSSLQAELDQTNRGVLALYAELDQQAEQLRLASELKSRFLSYMSHEFRTPL